MRSRASKSPSRRAATSIATFPRGFNCGGRFRSGGKGSVLAARVLSLRQVQVGYVFGDGAGLGSGEIGQRDDGQLIIDVARDGGLESLPGAVVAYYVVAVTVVDEPAEAVAVFIGLAVFQLRGSPHFFEAGALQQFLGVQGGIPLREIQDGEVEAAIGGGVDHGRDPFLIFQFAFDQAIAGGAVGNYVGLADDARGLHAERLKDSLLQKVSVEFSGDAMNQNSQGQKSQIAVFPLRAGRIGQRDALDQLQQFGLRSSPCEN